MFLAPCGHPGVPVIGTFVLCSRCDGKAPPPQKVYDGTYVLALCGPITGVSGPHLSKLECVCKLERQESGKFKVIVQPGVYNTLKHGQKDGELLGGRVLAGNILIAQFPYSGWLYNPSYTAEHITMIPDLVL